jgi:hypothetical protein
MSQDIALSEIFSLWGTYIRKKLFLAVPYMCDPSKKA